METQKQGGDWIQTELELNPVFGHVLVLSYRVVWDVVDLSGMH